LNDADRGRWLSVFAEICDRFNWVCYSYCLMDNHYHLFIETPEGNLSQGMRQLNGVYTQRFNRFHNRVGHLYQGRYKAILVQKEAYLLELSRYIVLNPVRARMVNAPQEWPWSNYRATIGLASVEDMQCKISGETNLDEVPRPQKRQNPKPLKTYKNMMDCRDEAIIAAYRSGGYSMKEIAAYFDLHYSSARKIIKGAGDSQFKT
jgi:REP element-mobilizing transposase RayT